MARTRQSVIAGALALAVGAVGAAAAGQPRAPGYDEAKTTIWALEQSIYAGRAKGTMANYVANQSPYFRAWPVAASTSAGPPKVGAPLTGDQEQVTLTFVDMAYDGHTAVMMYRTHRTRRSDGTAADDYFEVTHIWSKEDGQWRVLGARPQPVPAPAK